LILLDCQEENRVARYLVTGGAGFVGSHLVEALLVCGHSVRVLDDLSSGSLCKVPPQVELIAADVVDEGAVAAAFEAIDGCYHLAAIASVERCNRDWLPAHRVNLTGTVTIFDAARRLRGGRTIPVVYASTAAVYGNSADLPLAEDRSLAPLSAYGADKAACELHARAAGTVHRVPTVGLRFFNLYGPRQDPHSPYSGVISRFIDRLRCGEPIEIFGDGQQTRDFTYIGDAVTALRRAMGAAALHGPIFNICTGIGTSVRGLAETIARLCGTRLVIRYLASREGDLRRSIGDPRRAVADLGFTAGTPLERGLRLTLEALANGGATSAIRSG
jgi:UDP-glucose 4-epimerase